MSLTQEEYEFMLIPGNRLQPVEEPKDTDQPHARYPIGIAEISKEHNTIRWVFERGRETWPLPAGYGRYALFGACKYLESDENGWEYCSVYDERPKVCQDFEMGSPKCQRFRLREGVDQAAEGD